VTRTQAVTSWDNGTWSSFITTLDNILGYLIGLLYFVAVVFALYGGFQILTAAWDEEKVKKGKTTLINAVIGLVVIFLASIIVRWVISLSGNVIK
jgi:type IV secretory pathway VirB2 component (pilin)